MLRQTTASSRALVIISTIVVALVLLLPSAFGATTGPPSAEPTADYVVRTAETPGEVVPAYGTFWPSARSTKDAVRVDFTCGYGAAEDVPQGIKRAVLLLVGSWYGNRETVAPVTMSEIPQSATWMLSPFRVWRF